VAAVAVAKACQVHRLQRARRHGKGLHPLPGGLKAQIEHTVMEAANNMRAHYDVPVTLSVALAQATVAVTLS
jgi:hypothetical protein